MKNLFAILASLVFSLSLVSCTIDEVTEDTEIQEETFAVDGKQQIPDRDED